MSRAMARQRQNRWYVVLGLAIVGIAPLIVSYEIFPGAGVGAYSYSLVLCALVLTWSGWCLAL